MKLSITPLGAAAIITGTVLLAGCGPNANAPAWALWHKPGATAAQRKHDFDKCYYDAQLATASARDDSLSDGMNLNNRRYDLARSCMELKSYVYGPVEPSDPAR